MSVEQSALPHHEIFVDVTARIVTMVRTRRPFASAEELKQEWLRFAEAVRGVERDRFGLVVDSRAGPGLQNPALEESFATFRRKVTIGFARVAVVSASVAAKLHVRRNALADGASNIEVFSSVEDARAYVGTRVK